jgi:pimeloyl-ACP methyl ester carboxylesterase
MRAHLVADAGGFLRFLEIPGDEPPIVWLHGLLCASTAELAPVAVRQPLASRRSLLIDFLGYGFSDRPPVCRCTPSRPPEFAAGTAGGHRL